VITQTRAQHHQSSLDNYWQ